MAKRDETRKLDGWVKSLGEAGFLDNLDDGWSLADRPSTPGAAIRVEGSPGGASEPEVVPGSRPSRTTPVPVRSAKQTFSGIPTPSSFPSLPGDSWAEAVEGEPTPALEDLGHAVEAERSERLSAPARGHRITVPPAPAEEDFGGVGTIVEELPTEVGSRQMMRETVRPGRRGGPSARRAEEPGKQAGQRMSELAEIGDFSGALAVAEESLRDDPGDGAARRMRERCRTVLLQMYESRLGPLDRTPRLAIAEKELIWRNLDPVSGFVLSRIDGFSTFEDIIDVSSLPRFETCRILDQLLLDGLIGVDR